MNHDDTKPEMKTWIEPDLEARVVAWISGEASAFEVAELERLTTQKPELTIFKRRLEAVSGLVAEAVRPDREPLKLSPARRVQLLKNLRAEEKSTESTAATPVPLTVAPTTRKKRIKNNGWMGMVAACVAVGLFSITALQFMSFGLRQSKVALFHYERPLRPDPSSTLLGQQKIPDRELLDREETISRAQSRSNARESEERKRKVFGDSSIRQPNDGAGATAALELIAGNQSYLASSTMAGSRLNKIEAEANSPMNTLDKDQLRRSVDLNYVVAGKKEKRDEESYGLEAGQVAAAAATFEKRPAAFSARGSVGDVLAEPAAPPPAPAITEADTLTLSAFQVSTVPTNKPRAIAPQRQLADAKQIVSTDTFVDRTDGPLDSPKNSDVVEAIIVKTDAPDATSEVHTAKEPVSTFSLHVSDVSFRLAQADLSRGDMPDAERIRPEEFYNAFNYGDPSPAMDEKIACRIEQAAHPFMQQRNLVRIAMKVPSTGRGAGQPLRLTVLLDTSGSMEREDRAASVQSAMKVLISLLGPNDRLNVIGFARQPRLIVEQLPGDQAEQALDLIARTPSEGGTNLEAALTLAAELAQRHQDATAQNRIVLLTDGAANLGDSDPARLASSIETLRQQGIAFDACGVGLDGLDDGMLEALTRKGDGRYYVLDTPESADAGFARQLAGAFRPAAENVKVQVRFNPARVGNYRLIGFEQHRLNEEDFRNDTVDAAELAAEEAAVALYQVEVLPQGEGELGEVYVRFRDAATGSMVERSWTLMHDAQAPTFDRSTPSMKLAATAAMLAEKLRDAPMSDAIDLDELAPIMNTLRSHYAHEPRVQELVAMFEQMRRMGKS